MRQNARVKIPKDLIFFSLLFLLSLFVFSRAIKMPTSPHEPLGPGSMPLVLAIGLGCISLVRIVKLSMDWVNGIRNSAKLSLEDERIKQDQQVDRKSPEDQPGDLMIPRPVLAVGAIIGLCLMVAIMQFRWMGFRIIAFFYVLILSFFLQRREQRVSRLSFWVIAVIVAAVMSFGVFWLFTTVFNVRLR